MNALLAIRRRLNTVYALIAVVLVAVAVTNLRLAADFVTPGVGLAAFGLLGMVLGRLSAEPGAPSDADRSSSAATDGVDRLLRSIARLLAGHMSDAEAYSKRLDGANARLSQHPQGAGVNEVVLALIADNREMRQKLSSVRNQLEDSRLKVLTLQHNLVRSEEAGFRDVVTQIGNRRFFEAAFADELERARRTPAELCLAFADLDRFKTVNDRFGHLVGDRVLRLFAEILAQNVRGADRVARFGGEEFAVLLPGVGLPEAVAVVERIRAVLESKQWTLEPSGERVGKVTASFGVAQLRPGESGTELIKRADAQLYAAKERGRNRVISEADEPTGSVVSRAGDLRTAAG